MEPSASKPISRRSALIAAGLGVASLASASLTGCAQAKDLQSQLGGQKEWDGKSYLPMGSVVKLRGDKYDMEYVVITRRPKSSKVGFFNEDGTMTYKPTEAIFDYEVMCWPAGRVSDCAVIPHKPTDAKVIYADHISEVLFMGYEDEREKEAQELLASAKESGISGPDALESMTSGIFSQLNGEA